VETSKNGVNPPLEIGLPGLHLVFLEMIVAVGYNGSFTLGIVDPTYPY
jgi:hypothetical protein